MLCGHHFIFISNFRPSSYGKKDILEIRFEYHNKEFTNRIVINLEETTSWILGMNKYEICSSDQTWFCSMKTQMADLFKNVSHRSPLRLLFDIPFAVLGYALFITAIILFLNNILGFEYGERPIGAQSITGRAYDSFQSETTILFIPAVDVYLGSLITWIVSCFSVCWLYPDVEFNLNSRRSNRRKKIRNSFLWIIGTILIPIILTLLL